MANKPILMINPDVEARFWGNVDKTPGQGPHGDCWCFTKIRAGDNYPVSLWVGRHQYRATHIALIIAGRPMPEPGLLALHSCDHPPCVREEHLRWGTELDNRKDAIARRKRGRTFTPAEVRDIRASSERQADIARRYGTSSACISNIRKRVSHHHID